MKKNKKKLSFFRKLVSLGLFVLGGVFIRYGRIGLAIATYCLGGLNLFYEDLIPIISVGQLAFLYCMTNIFYGVYLVFATQSRKKTNRK